jgi:hypothetical protein
MGASFCGTIGRRHGKGVPTGSGLATSGVSNARASESIAIIYLVEHFRSF